MRKWPTSWTTATHVPYAFDPSRLQTVIHGAAPCPVWAKEQMIEWWGPIFDFEVELPRHTTGKLYKRLLRDKYWQREARFI